MVIFHIVLRNDTAICHPLFSQKVCGDRFLKKCITHVLLICQDKFNGGIQPTGTSRCSLDAVSLESLANAVETLPFQIFTEDAFHHLGFFLIDDEVTVLILVITKEPGMVNQHFALLVTILQTKADVLRKTFTFLLSQRCHDGEHNLAFGIKRVDSFLFKINGDVLILELSDVVKAVKGITGKTADRLGYHHVNLAIHAVIYEPVKLLSLFGIGAGNAVIRINSGAFPCWVLLDVLGVVFHLRLIACCLFISISRHTAVGCHSGLWYFVLNNPAADSSLGRDHCNCSHV